MFEGRRPSSRDVSTIKLREYADKKKSPRDRVIHFLQDTDGVSRADISGACSLSWAVIHKVLSELIEEGLITIESTHKPEVYRWRH